MAKVTITIEDVPGDNVSIKASFTPGVSVNEPTKTPAQQAVSHVLNLLRAIGEGDVER